jgi:TolB-like protein/DNA-binding winged helix-turn-helix (wHTH) protein
MRSEFCRCGNTRAILAARPQATVPQPSFRFGEFELDGSRYELRRHGRVLRLERLPMDLLLLLAEKDGHVVTRREIVERLWGGDVFVDTEHGINTAVRKIRAALGEEAGRPRFIQTVQGKGYRFVVDGPEARAAAGGGSAEAPEPSPVAPSTDTTPAGPTKRSRRRSIVAAALLTLAAASFFLSSLIGARARSLGSRPAPIHSIAVLPLANLSGDASQDYYADGLTDELITVLARSSSLRVVSRTSVMQYKGARRPLPDIARELGVDGVLEGSVSRSGNRVHLTVQLIHAASDTHVWADSYDREFGDALSLPSELSEAIAREVKASVAPVPSPRVVQPDAHDAYLRGRYFWFSEDYDRSREYFEKAIRLQPDYAPAWSGLADAYVVRAVATMVPVRDVAEQVRRAAHRAVELDDTLPEGHNALAALYLFVDWDWARADAESLHALALSPSYAEARHLRSYILCALNRPAEAVEEQRRSTELDPFARPWALGYALIHARRFDAAVSELRLRAEAQPRDSITRFMLSDAYWYLRSWAQSAEEGEKGCLAMGDDASAAAIRKAFAAGGGRAVAEWALERAMSRKGYVSPWNLAHRYARLGRKEEALARLEDAYREHSPRLVYLQAEPDFDFLHEDERYRALVRKIGLPPAF